MGQGRNYNNPAENDEDEKTSKIKKVTITQEESNTAEASEPTPAADTFKQVKERKEEEHSEEPTTDDDRYRASSG